MQHFRNLKIWERSHQLVLSVYRLTASFPKDERFGLISQLRRSAASVPTNIAEGSKRSGQQDFARFLNIAEGSLSETEYLIVLSSDLGYLPATRANELLDEICEIARMLNALRAKVDENAVRSKGLSTQPSAVRSQLSAKKIGLSKNARSGLSSMNRELSATGRQQSANENASVQPSAVGCELSANSKEVEA